MLRSGTEYCQCSSHSDGPNSVSRLKDFVDYLSSSTTARELQKTRILLFVDGYDEIALDERHQVSQSLLLFSALNMGNFYLTCRTFYDVFDIRAERYLLDGFGYGDATHFITAFSSAYGCPLDPSGLLKELTDRGFQSFSSHPLMLALVCILKTGPNPEIPKRAITLIERALDTLTFRWDEAKGIARSSRVPVDGRERIDCMARVAYSLRVPMMPESGVKAMIRRQLELMQREHVDVNTLLTEIVQWYGVLVPAGSGTWTFVHRTLHDFSPHGFGSQRVNSSPVLPSNGT